MLRLTWQGRPVRLDLTSNSRDPVDAYAGAGWWRDTGELLTDAELDEIQDEFAGEIEEAYRQHQIESAADADLDLER